MNRFRNAMLVGAAGHAMLEQLFAEEKMQTVELADGRQEVRITPDPQAVPAEKQKPEGMPDAALDWRTNVERLVDEVAASPLPSRQLKRSTARALARQLSSAQAIREREERILGKKRARAARKHAHASAQNKSHSVVGGKVSDLDGG